MARVDSHQHFWQRSRGDYAWLREDEPALAPIVRDFAPDDLAPLLTAGGIEATVVVQAADTVAETEFLLGIASRCDFVQGVVGWVDLARADAAHTLERLARHPKFKGVRPMLQDLAEDDWIARRPHPEAVRALVRLGLRFDALVKTPHLPALLEFAQAWPELPVVVDHAAKPRLAEGWQGAWAPAWRAGLAALAALPNVRCKFSALATEMSPDQCATPARLAETARPVWDCLMEWFGPGRTLWGSDWPVLTLAASHGAWLEAADALVSTLDEAGQVSVWAGCAREFYGLPGGRG